MLTKSLGVATLFAAGAFLSAQSPDLGLRVVDRADAAQSATLACGLLCGGKCGQRPCGRRCGQRPCGRRCGQRPCGHRPCGHRPCGHRP